MSTVLMADPSGEDTIVAGKKENGRRTWVAPKRYHLSGTRETNGKFTSGPSETEGPSCYPSVS